MSNGNEIGKGPALAAALGGEFHYTDETVRFEWRTYFVRCGPTGKVALIVESVATYPPEPRAPINLGRISEPVEVLSTEFDDALRANGLACPGRSDDACRLDGCPVHLSRAEQAEPDPYAWPESLGFGGL